MPVFVLLVLPTPLLVSFLGFDTQKVITVLCVDVSTPDVGVSSAVCMFIRKLTRGCFLAFSESRAGVGCVWELHCYTTVWWGQDSVCCKLNKIAHPEHNESSVVTYDEMRWWMYLQLLYNACIYLLLFFSRHFCATTFAWRPCSPPAINSNEVTIKVPDWRFASRRWPTWGFTSQNT